MFEQSPEAEAFSRWQKGEFTELERLYARKWREVVTTLDLEELANRFRKLGIDGKSCKTLNQSSMRLFTFSLTKNCLIFTLILPARKVTNPIENSLKTTPG